ncbi:MAG: hypothetical protein JSS61_04425 [Verrucomicrobia bacterium]|nr:hypothetical protein [Verrucomicrobiota bacterium]
MISLFLPLLLLLSSLLQADEPQVHELPPPPPKEDKMEYIPWLTGPLLTSGGHVIPNGHYNIEPYMYVTTNYGAFNSHWHSQSVPNFYNLLWSISTNIGIPGNFDVAFTPQWSWNHTSGASNWDLVDMPIGLDYQILSDTPEDWWPAIKLQLKGNIPIGRYQKLHPNKLGTDIGGTGSFLPGIGLVFSNLYHIHKYHYLSMRYNVSYVVPTPVHVKNYNAYGGGHHTRGKVFPGAYLTCLVGMEYSLSQRWVLAMDIDYTHFNKTRFSGHKGKTNGVRNAIGSPSAESFSLAPAIEYNWNAYIGVIAGCWFTVAGRNTTDFASGVVAVNIYH